MALINRVSRLFKADFNAVLDHIEEPEQLVKQAIRDMEDELGATEHRIAACTHEQEALTARRQEIRRAIGELDEQLDLCFEAGNENLARSTIRRKLESEALGKRLESKFEANERFQARQQKQLEENRATLEGLRQKAELFVSRAPSGEIGTSVDDLGRIARELRISDDEVEIAFLREQAARSGS